MSKLNKKYLLGFVLIIVVGIGLLAGGIINYLSKDNPNLIETQGTIVGVQTRNGEDGKEYRPMAVNYYVEEEDKWYTTSVLTWFSQPLHDGDTLQVRYERGNPTHTEISNTTKESGAYILMGVGGVVAVVGLAFTCKYIYDVKRGKNPTA